ncbi:MAG: carbohydrate-binding family 9-like protein [Silvibacterium sp.]
MVGPKTAPLVIVSERIDNDSKPDGDLGKKMWFRAKPVWFDQAAFSESRYRDLKTKVASCWTTQFLYLAFWCPYETLTVYQGEDATIERDRLWERDVVEAFINPDPQSPSHYYEFEIAPTNQWLDLDIDLARTPFNDAGWNSGFEHATRVDVLKRVWTAEMRIPVRSMGLEAIFPDVDWRINFYRCDGPGDDSARRMLSWGRLPVRVSGGTFHQPASFGVLHFDGSS